MLRVVLTVVVTIQAILVIGHFALVPIMITSDEVMIVSNRIHAFFGLVTLGLGLFFLLTRDKFESAAMVSMMILQLGLSLVQFYAAFENYGYLVYPVVNLVLAVPFGYLWLKSISHYLRFQTKT